MRHVYTRRLVLGLGAGFLGLAALFGALRGGIPDDEPVAPGWWEPIPDWHPRVAAPPGPTCGGGCHAVRDTVVP